MGSVAFASWPRTAKRCWEKTAAPAKPKTSPKQPKPSPKPPNAEPGPKPKKKAKAKK